MPIICCCRNRHFHERDTRREAIELPIQPPRARLSVVPSQSDIDMYHSSLLYPQAPSQLIIPAYHSMVDPEAVDVEDSDDDNLGREARETNMGALGLFGAKLMRRLSHRADLKTNARSSSGANDGELARRAELKRLMHKRIQEELKSEEEEEEEEEEGVEEDFTSTPLRQSSVGNGKDVELPGGGPRDTIEFSVSGIDEEAEKVVGTPSVILPSPAPIMDQRRGLHQFRTGFSEPAQKSTEHASHGSNKSVIGTASPPCPTLVHISREDCCKPPSASPRRLSCSTVHIESDIEPLVETRQGCRLLSHENGTFFSQDNDDVTHASILDDIASHRNLTIGDEIIDSTSPAMRTCNVPDTERQKRESHDFSHLLEVNNGRYSPLDLWLRSQDLHYASTFLSRPGSEVATDQYEPGNNQQTEGPQKAEASLYSSGRENHTVDSSLSLNVRASGSYLKALGYTNESENLPITTPSDESIALERALIKMGNVLRPGNSSTGNQTQDASSRYTTRSNSQQNTPSGSRLDLTDSLENHKSPQSPVSVHTPANPYRPTAFNNSGNSSYQTALNTTPLSKYVNCKTEVQQPPMVDARSTDASETASFKHREEELKSIEKRFSLVPARKHLVGTGRSKFREEFEGPKGSTGRKSFIFSKLHLAFPGRCKAPVLHPKFVANGEKKETYPINCPSLNVTRKSCELDSNGGYELRPKIAGEALMNKGFTVPTRETEAGGLLDPKFTEATMLDNNTNGTKANRIPARHHRPSITKAKSIDGTRKGLTKGLLPLPRSPDSMPTTNKNEKDNTVDIHTGVLQEWVEQLQAEDAGRQTRTTSRIAMPGRQLPRLRTPPQSWAKWPSHTRKERTTLAGEKDQVKSWDFAMTMNPHASGPEARGNPLPKDTNLITASQSLSRQVGKALKSSWYKIIPHPESLRCPSGRHRSAIQNSHKFGGFLEYPELELLPNVEGYREAQALDQQIDTMKRRSTSGRRATVQSSSDNAERPLASRISQEVYKLQAASEDIAWNNVEYHSGPSPDTKFLSPAHALLIRRSKSGDPGPPYRPQPQYPYNHCAQSQMRNGGGKEVVQGRLEAVIKRAKSTGNIETKLPGSILAMGEATPSDRKTWKSGLRRHASLSWIRSRHRDQDGLVERRLA